MCAVLALSLAMSPHSRAGGNPNVLFIAVDDLKPLLGCYGNGAIKSPHIDRLAARGVTFLNAQCQFPVCGPSRVSLLTGMRPESTGVMTLRTKMRDVRPDILTLPQHFMQEGYITAGVGKVFDPRSCDSQEACDKQSWSLPYIFAPPSSVPSAEKDRRVAVAGDDADDAFPDHRICEAGLARMRELASAGTPFLLAVGFKKPHLPFVAPRRFWDLYDRGDIDVHPFQQRAEGTSGYGYNDSRETRGYDLVPDQGPIPEDIQKLMIHGYRACVSWVDSLVGRLLDELDHLGLADTTVVVLWGDHGFHLGDHGQWGKHTPFEDAARSPLIIVDPRLSTGGAMTEAPAEFIDVFPTLCSLAGLPVPAHLQGVDLTPTLKDPMVFSRPAATTIYKSRGAYGYSIRTPRYRYIEWIDTKSLKRVGQDLFDFETDPLGKKNWAAEESHREALGEMIRSLHADTRGWTTLDQALKQ